HDTPSPYSLRECPFVYDLSVISLDLQVVIPERGPGRLDLSRALPEILAVDNDGQARRIGENGGGRGTGGEDERAKSQRDQREPLRRRPVLLHGLSLPHEGSASGSYRERLARHRPDEALHLGLAVLVVHAGADERVDSAHGQIDPRQPGLVGVDVDRKSVV